MDIVVEGECSGSVYGRYSPVGNREGWAATLFVTDRAREAVLCWYVAIER